MNSISMFDNTKEALPDFLDDIHMGKIQLPDLQRSFVWSDEQIVKLLGSISQAFPIGAILTLKAGNSSVKFKPRLIEGVELKTVPIPETLLLDGQQRCTSLHSCLRSGQPVAIRDRRNQKVQQRWYYIDIHGALNPNMDRTDAIISFPQSRIKRGGSPSRNLNCSTPEREFESLMFPVSQVFNYAVWRAGFQKFWNYDPLKLDLLDQFEAEVIKKFEHYQIAVIQLKPELSKIAVCQAFEDVNLTPTKLTFFDLTTAVFAADDFSLRDHYSDVSKQLSKYAVLQFVRDTDWLQAVTLVTTYNRRQEAIESGGKLGQLPAVGCCRRDVFNLTLEEYKRFSPITLAAFKEAAKFLHGLGFQHCEDIAYPMQLVILVGMLSIVGFPNESMRSKLERWWWLGMFGEVYAGWHNTVSARDILEVPQWLFGGDFPSVAKNANLTLTRLLSITQRRGAVYLALNTLLRKYGAIDFLSGEQLSNVKVFDGVIESHHVFPEAWCKQQLIEPKRYNSLINRTPLREKTNRFIGGKAPSEYLAKLVQQQGISKQRLDTILRSHLIEPNTLWDDDFEAFFELRIEALSDLISQAIGKAVQSEVSDELDSANLNISKVSKGKGRR